MHPSRDYTGREGEAKWCSPTAVSGSEEAETGRRQRIAAAADVLYWHGVWNEEALNWRRGDLQWGTENILAPFYRPGVVGEERTRGGRQRVPY
jgi:hypothetical protein